MILRPMVCAGMTLLMACGPDPRPIVGEPDDSCPAAACGPGLVCEGGICKQLCTNSADCPTVFFCSNSNTCEARSLGNLKPTITSINGTGSHDAGAEHAGKHLVDRLVIEGTNLAAATIHVKTEAGAEVPVTLCGLASSTRVEVALPGTLAEGRYNLSAVNEAGATCEAGFQILQGQPGTAGINGTWSNGSGDTLVQLINESENRVQGALYGAQVVTVAAVVDATGLTVTVNGVDYLAADGWAISLATYAVTEVHANETLPDHAVLVLGADFIPALDLGGTMATPPVGQNYVLIGQKGLGEGNGIERVGDAMVQTATVIIDSAVLGFKNSTLAANQINGDHIVDGSLSLDDMDFDLPVVPEIFNEPSDSTTGSYSANYIGNSFTRNDGLLIINRSEGLRVKAGWLYVRQLPANSSGTPLTRCTCDRVAAESEGNSECGANFATLIDQGDTCADYIGVDRYHEYTRHPTNNPLTSLAITMSGDVAVEHTLTVSGAVGIGTANPTTRLHVVDGGANLKFLNSGGPQIRLETNSNVAASIAFNTSGADQVVLSGHSRGLVISGSHPGLNIGYGQNDTNGDSLVVKGRVGIGTSSPALPLEVSDDGSLDLSNGIAAINITDTASTEVAAAPFVMFNWRNPADGGITQLGFIGETSTGTRHMSFTNRQPGALDFATNNTHRMRITSAGNVGIGLTEPVAKLEVNGDIVVRGDAAEVKWVRNANGRAPFVKIVNEFGGLQYEAPFGVGESPNVAHVFSGGSGGSLMTILGNGNTTIGGAFVAGNAYFNSTEHGGDNNTLVVIDRGAQTNYADLVFQSAAVDKWSLGMRQGGDDLQLSSIGTAKTFTLENANLSFGSAIRQMINLYTTEYGIGIQGSTQYFRSAQTFAWFVGGTHHDGTWNPGAGGTTRMTLNGSGLLTITGPTAGASPTLSTSGDIKMGAGASLFFDDNYNYGAGSYIRASNTNEQSFVVGGVEKLNISSTGVKVQNGPLNILGVVNINVAGDQPGAHIKVTYNSSFVSSNQAVLTLETDDNETSDVASWGLRIIDESELIFGVRNDGKVNASNLAGTGNAYVCVNSTGELYRSLTACQ